MKSISRRLLAWLVACAWVYLTCLSAWLALHLLTGDRLWMVSLSTSLAQHAFWPLPALAVLAALTRRRSLWVGSGATLLVWLALFGGLFNLPHPAAHASASTLRAMTYNVEYRNTDVEAVVGTIQTAGPDVVGLQELTPVLTARLGPTLAETYPYQVFDPREGVSGMGIVSRYPIEPLPPGAELDGTWVGQPQVVRISLPAGRLLVMNAHFVHGAGRDANAAQVARWLARQSEPVVLLGDLNATDLSDAHATLADAGLRDVWREVGWGYGSTFPASGEVSRRRGIPALTPARLVRIDYVLHTPQLAAHSVERLSWDGRSDHLAVVAELALTSP